MSKKFKISVITVNYNNAAGLKKTIKSYIELKQESDCSLEYIVIDGDSNDGSVEVLRESEKHIDAWVSEKDWGIYDAMNKGLERSSADFVVFMNSGDVFLPAGFSELIGRVSREDYAYAARAFLESASGQKEVAPEVFPLFMRLPNHQAILFPLQELKRRTFLWNKYPVSADLDHKALFWFSGRMENIDHPVALCEHRGESLEYGSLKDVWGRAVSRYRIGMEHANWLVASVSFVAVLARQSFRLVANSRKAKVSSFGG